MFVTALAAFVALSPRTSLLGMAPLEKPPEVLQERARAILAEAGHDRKPVDSLFAFDANRDYLEDVQRRGLFRFGLLPFAAMYHVLRLLDRLPLTLDPTGWYLGATLLALTFTAAPAARFTSRLAMA